jgi:ribulose-bisphosphate carboxylase large chain
MNSFRPPTGRLALSGERFRVVYRIGATLNEAQTRARDICLEQTVEFPDDLIPAGPIREHVVGWIESLEADDGSCRATISFPVEAAGDDLSQLLNVVFGNISLKPAIRAEAVELSPSQGRLFRGPRFGRGGLRTLTAVADRPLLSTALKPMGLDPADLAELAHRFALGGIDLIKDDHGLTNQTFCPFEERVRRCAEAVERANQQTGFRCLYVPNVTAPPIELLSRARLAKALGSGALLVCPGLCGLEAMRTLADDDEVALPILSHPAFQGSFVVRPGEGLSHGLLFGQIARLAGADVTIFPNFGGRFSFTPQECCDLAAGTKVPMRSLKSIFPAPAGGLSLSRVRDLEAVYGRDMVILVGGGLFKHGPELLENCRAFRAIVSGIQ